MTMKAAIQWDYSDRAATYEHRADYDTAAIDRLLQHVYQPQSAQAADIGAGTGKLTRALLAAGMTVMAIEPNETMRTVAAAITGNAGAQWLHGQAERLPLPSNAFDLACFGSSFNVVDAAQSLREVTRILTRGGVLAILWNHRNLQDPLQAAVEAAIRAHIPNYAHGSRREDPSACVLATGQFVALDSYRCAFEYATCREDYLAAWRSHATLARAAQSQFEPIMQSIANIVPQGEFSVPYSTAVWVFRRAFA
jgi:ubiquinone/menaquinone biosynthesis C-methylase UbiE